MANRQQLNLMCCHVRTPCPDGPNCPYQHNEALLYPVGMPYGYVRKICPLSVLWTTCPHSYYCWDIHVDDPPLPATRRVGTGVFIPRPRFTLMGAVGPPRAPPPPAPVVRPLLAGLDGDGAEVEWTPFSDIFRVQFEAFIADCRRGRLPE